MRLQNVMVQTFYGLNEDPVLPGLHTVFEFCMSKTTVISEIKKGALVEYPLPNNYPPFWKKMTDIKKGDHELGNFLLYYSNF